MAFFEKGLIPLGKSTQRSHGVLPAGAIKFFKFAKFRIDADGFPAEGTVYLTIRYKDNVQPFPPYTGVGLYSANKITPLAILGGANDHRWKTTTVTLDIADLEVIDGDFRIKLGDNYTAQNAGELNIDKIKLSTDKDISEFEPDAPGLWPADRPGQSPLCGYRQRQRVHSRRRPLLPLRWLHRYLVYK